MKFILFILLFPFLVQAQTINAPGQPSSVTVNAPGQLPSIRIGAEISHEFNVYKKSDEPFVTAFDYTPHADLTFPSSNIAFSSSDVESVGLDLEVDGILFWHAYEKWKRTTTVVMGSCAAGDDGFFIGIKTNSPSNNLHGLGIETVVANKVRMYMWNVGKYTTNFVDFTSAYTPGDIYTFTVERNVDVVTFTGVSPTETKSITYSLAMGQDKTNTFMFPNLTQKFHTIFKQGNFTITDDHIESYIGNMDLMIVGNSITQGNGARSTAQIWSQAVKLIYPYTTVFAGGGNISQYILDAMPAIIRANPEQVAIKIGTNDLNGGVSLATLQANYASIVSQLVSAGITPIVELISPGTHGNTSTFNAGLVTTYGSSYRIIDAYSILKDGALSTFDTRYTYDQIHETQEGQDIRRDAFLTQWKTTVAPISIKAEVLTSTTIKVTFSEKITATNTGFTFKKNGSDHNPTGISGSGTNFLTFTVPSTLEGDVITMSYSGGDAEDADGNDLASITDRSAINLISPPTIVSMTVTGIHTVRVVFSEAVTTTGTGWHFNIGTYNTVTGVSGSGTTTVDFTFASTAISGISTYNVGYESPYGNTVDANSNPLQSFKNTNLTSGF